MKFDFKSTFKHIHNESLEKTNNKIEEIKNSSEGDSVNKFNLILNELLDSNNITTEKVLEKYHISLMKFLSEKGIV